ncbi:MAG TPA: N-acetylglucosamine-6-phosphate deacetylase [Thermoanaerobaculia bacterium]|nr:N-acetylglucosamine-6-phosphate deacetylase [Thermoanaerobaculia bacterium]
MTVTTIRGTAFVGGHLHPNVTISLDRQYIATVDLGSDTPSNADANLIVPGFIDLHVHGADGADFMDGTAEAVRTVTAAHLRSGTTALAATTLSASHEDTNRAIDAIVAARRVVAAPGAEIIAIHLEGPFINRGKAGAQHPGSIRPADLREVENWLSRAPDLKWIMTVAPEIPGVIALIEHFRHQILFSIGHTAATYSDAVVAMEAGARHFTHLFNAMLPFHHREPGAIGAALVTPNITAELIADGIHVHPAVLNLAMRLLDRRVILVTDAMRACGMPEGQYKLYSQDVTVAGGAARLADGTLAGSTLTMIDALRNLVELAGVPLEKAIPSTSEIPARVAGVSNRKGCIESGYDADLVVMNRKLEISAVYAAGQEAYLR